MNPRHAYLYAHVIVIFWPWLWWQLERLNRWMKANGRGLLVSVDRRGNVSVRCIGDAPPADDLFIPVPASARLAAACDPVPCHWLCGARALPRECPPTAACAAAGFGRALPLPDT